MLVLDVLNCLQVPSSHIPSAISDMEAQLESLKADIEDQKSKTDPAACEKCVKLTTVLPKCILCCSFNN